MRRPNVGIECGSVVVNLVEENNVGLAGRLEDIETAAAWLIPH